MAMNQPQTTDSCAIAVFARAPIAGKAKTRLITSLGPDSAADLQAEFIKYTLRTAVAAEIGPVFLWCDPDCTHPVFQQCKIDFNISLHPQCEGDLGTRMAAAFALLCPQQPVLLVGTDCPALQPAHLQQAAFELRQGNDAVFFPAEDGGYVMVGLRRAKACLFADMPWGGPIVMALTRQRLRQIGWQWSEPLTLWDVDRPADLERLKQSCLMDYYVDGSA